MNHLGWAILLLLTSVGGAVAVGSGLVQGAAPPSPTHTAIVAAVTDGDTIRANDPDGRALGRVRLARIDAPELARDGRPDECWAPEATTALAELAPVGTTVVLRPDPEQPDRDRYGRLLRIVERDGRDVGQELLAEGVVRHSPPHWTSPDRHYREAEQQARSTPTGLWAHCPA
ncbi:thermonuclease family protein [Actinomycetota bacterium]